MIQIDLYFYWLLLEKHNRDGVSFFISASRFDKNDQNARRVKEDLVNVVDISDKKGTVVYSEARRN